MYVQIILAADEAHDGVALRQLLALPLEHGQRAVGRGGLAGGPRRELDAIIDELHAGDEECWARG